MNTNSTLSIIYTTVSTSEQAQYLIKTLLEKKLIACANFAPITSMYYWQNTLCQTSEIALILKTAPTTSQALQEALRILHPYDVPCIIIITAQTTAPFFAFITDITEQDKL